MKGVKIGHYEMVILDILHKDLCGIKYMGCFEMFSAHFIHNALSLKIQ